jgi:uncharacterized lipoprotein YajG
MKKILLGTAVAILLLTGCNEDKKPVQTTETTQDVKKDEVVAPTTTTEATEEVKKGEETAPSATTEEKAPAATEATDEVKKEEVSK